MNYKSRYVLIILLVVFIVGIVIQRCSKESGIKNLKSNKLLMIEYAGDYCSIDLDSFTNKQVSNIKKIKNLHKWFAKDRQGCLMNP